MDITKAKRATPGRIRTVHPLGDADQDFFVEMEELSESEQSAILDKVGYMPGTNKATMSKLDKVTRIAIKRRIKNFGGLVENGVELECTDENKLKFKDIIVEVDSEEKSLWQLCVEAESALKDEESKNS